MRITEKDLNLSVKNLNIIKKLNPNPYTKTDNGLKANVGTYLLDGAYGGWKLARMSKGGGQSDISSGGFISKKELYNQIQAIINAHYNEN